jgi:hypothetical protein
VAGARIPTANGGLLGRGDADRAPLALAQHPAGRVAQLEVAGGVGITGPAGGGVGGREGATGGPDRDQAGHDGQGQDRGRGPGQDRAAAPAAPDGGQGSGPGGRLAGHGVGQDPADAVFDGHGPASGLALPTRRSSA